MAQLRGAPNPSSTAAIGAASNCVTAVNANMHPATAKIVMQTNSNALDQWRLRSKAVADRTVARLSNDAAAVDEQAALSASPSGNAMIDSTSSGSCVDSPKRSSFAHITRPIMIRAPRRSST